MALQRISQICHAAHHRIYDRTHAPTADASPGRSNYTPSAAASIITLALSYFQVSPEHRIAIAKPDTSQAAITDATTIPADATESRRPSHPRVLTLPEWIDMLAGVPRPIVPELAPAHDPTHLGHDTSAASDGPLPESPWDADTHSAHTA